jgi:hypothetical protein
MQSMYEVMARVRIPEPRDVRYRVRPARQIIADARRMGRTDRAR